MAENYFEAAKITVNAEIDGGKKPYSGPVEVKFLKNGKEELKKVTANATAGKLDAPVEYVAPDVAKKEKTYDLSVVCSYLGKNKKLLNATIWPKNVKAEFEDQQGTKLGQWDFRVKQKGSDDQELSADAAAKADIVLGARAPYSIAVEAPFRVLEDNQRTKGEYRDHIVKIKRNIKAKFVTPDVTKAPYTDDADHKAKRQWVNRVSATAAPAAGHGCDSFGHTIVITVSADPPEDGRKDDKVYFQVSFGKKESDRNTPKRKVLDDPAVNDLEEKKLISTGHVKLLADNGTASFQIELGKAGGDTCEVTIGGTEDLKDGKLKLINWRKMYAQTTKLNTATKPGLATAVEGFKPVFIDFEEDTATAVNLTSAEAPAGAIIDAKVIVKGATGKALVIGDHNADTLKTKLNDKYKNQNLPCAHVIFCDYQYDAKDLVHDVSGLAVTKSTKIAFPTGTTVPGVKVEASSAGNKANFLSQDLRDGSDPIKSCEWKSQADSNKKGNVPRDHILIGEDLAGGNVVLVKLPPDALVEVNADHTVHISLKVAYANGPYNGWCTSGDRHNVIALGRSDARLCGTIVHECGHAIQQVGDSAAHFPGLTAPPHKFQYTLRGHSGSHCGKGIKESTFKAGGNMTYENGQQATCIMYGSTGARKTESAKFCDLCSPYVIAVDVESVSTK